MALSACATNGDVDMDDGMSASTQASASTSASASASAPVMIGGAAMLPTNTIVQNAMLSNNHKTLVKAVQAAGLVDTLSGPGPFTVFAPTDAAFARIPAETLNQLMMPAMKDQLTGILTYHVVPGTMTADDLMAAIRSGGGSATLSTVAGGNLTATMEGGNVKLTDARGGVSYVTTANARASNGIVHEVNAVLLPPVPAATSTM